MILRARANATVLSGAAACLRGDVSVRLNELPSLNDAALDARCWPGDRSSGRARCGELRPASARRCTAELTGTLKPIPRAAAFTSSTGGGSFRPTFSIIDGAFCTGLCTAFFSTGCSSSTGFVNV